MPVSFFNWVGSLPLRDDPQERLLKEALGRDLDTRSDEKNPGGEEISGLAGVSVGINRKVGQLQKLAGV